MLERLGIATELAARRKQWARFAYVAPQDRPQAVWMPSPAPNAVAAVVLPPPNKAAGVVAEIMARFCQVYSAQSDERITVADMKGPSRRRQVAWPRHVCMRLVRDITGTSTPQIGREFGKRDHTTVLHGLKHADERMAEVPALKAAHDAVAAHFARPAVCPAAHATDVVAGHAAPQPERATTFPVEAL